MVPAETIRQELENTGYSNRSFSEALGIHPKTLEKALEHGGQTDGFIHRWDMYQLNKAGSISDRLMQFRDEHDLKAIQVRDLLGLKSAYYNKLLDDNEAPTHLSTLLDLIENVPSARNYLFKRYKIKKPK